jgi:hypothetical protein
MEGKNAKFTDIPRAVKGRDGHLRPDKTRRLEKAVDQFDVVAEMSGFNRATNTGMTIIHLNALRAGRGRRAGTRPISDSHCA